MKISPLGESAVLVETELLPDLAAPVVRQWVLALEGGVREGVREVAPSFTTVAVFYDPARIPRSDGNSPYATLCRWIESRLTRSGVSERLEPRRFVVPVCYGAEFGPDLDDVARATRLSQEAVIRLHSTALYEVRAIGFSPGFPYLSGLPEELHLPRRATPRTKVAAGSVGIGGAQTGIYSLVTPGGWNVIGRTPWKLFEATLETPCLFRIGDQLHFEPIGAEAMASADEGPLLMAREDDPPSKEAR